MLDFIFPRFCVACGRRLTIGEKQLCVECLRCLPRTRYHLMKISPLEQLFWGQVPIERAAAFLFYEDECVKRIIHKFKYHHKPEIAKYVARLFAEEIKGCGFFDDIDAVVPVPLSWKKKWRRGYNQCDWIAEGISLQTGLPVWKDAVKRAVNNPTQTVRSRFERQKNVEEIFILQNPEKVKDMHLLVVDDVITSGATTLSCMKELVKAGGNTRFSVLAIAKAGVKIKSEPKESEF